MTETRGKGTERTSVAAMCQAIQISYGLVKGKDRAVNLVHGGGHRKVQRTDSKRGDLFIDLDRLSGLEYPQWVEEALTILAVDLDCYEAGESLAQAGLVQQEMNGRYSRIQRQHSMER